MNRKLSFVLKFVLSKKKTIMAVQIKTAIIDNIIKSAALGKLSLLSLVSSKSHLKNQIAATMFGRIATNTPNLAKPPKV